MEVMIVEDDPVTLQFVSKWLEARGYTARGYADGLDALTAYETRAAQIILTDWMMPEMDGLELCRRIRKLEKPKYTYIVVLTAKSGHHDLVEALAAGADDFMSKPVQLDELAGRLKVAERICGLQNHLRQLETLLPTCMYCKKIRDDNEDWVPIEEYISERTGSGFSHGICPDCYAKAVARYRQEAPQGKVS